MKRKLTLTLTILLSLILTLSLPTHATQYQTLQHISSIYYDTTDKAYNIQTIDENGEGWIINLINSNQEDTAITQQLKQTLINKWLLIDFNDLETTEIYDDAIINWQIVEH